MWVMFDFTLPMIGSELLLKMKDKSNNGLKVLIQTQRGKKNKTIILFSI